MNKNKKYVPMGVDTIDVIYEGYAINDDVESDISQNMPDIPQIIKHN